jgi:sec-independent protein translocase protein TatA
VPNIGPLELAIVLVIALVVLGPKRLPEAGRAIGKGMREFRGALTSKIDGDDEADSDEPVKSTSAPNVLG